MICAGLSALFGKSGPDGDVAGRPPGQPIQKGQLDALLRATLKRPPSIAEIELFKEVHRPPKSKKDVDDDVRKMVDALSKSGAIPPNQDLQQFIDVNVKTRLALQSKPEVTRERFLVKGDATRRDWVSSTDLLEVGVDTPFTTTYIMPGRVIAGDGRFYIYWHALKSAARTEFNTMRQIQDVWGELFGLEKLLLEVLAVAVSELPKERIKGVTARDLKIDPVKVEAVLAGRDNLQLFVDDVKADAESRRTRIIFYMSAASLTLADIVVDASDFGKVYEQNLFDRDGNRVLGVTADGFDEFAIPREKIWTKRTASGDERTTLAVLNVSLNKDIPDELFEFKPPDGYSVSEMGSDGRPIGKAPDGVQSVPEPPKRALVSRYVLVANVLVLIAILAAVVYRRYIRRRT